MTDDEAFEAAMRIADREALRQRKRAFAAQCKRVQLLKRPKSDAFPFQPPEEVLDSMIAAIGATTDVHASTKLDFSSDPNLVFNYVVSAVNAHAEQCRKEGRESVQAELPARIDPDYAPTMYRLMNRLNELLGPHS